MEPREFKELLESLYACEEAMIWANGKSLEEVWTTCERGDWMLWLFNRMQDKEGWGDLRNKTLAKVKCARLVQHLMKDQRSLNALDVAERFAKGEATREELNAAADAATVSDTAYSDAAVGSDAAAYAAAAAAYAAYAAAAVGSAAAAYAAAYAATGGGVRKLTLKQCADICREVLITPLNVHL